MYCRKTLILNYCYLFSSTVLLVFCFLVFCFRILRLHELKLDNQTITCDFNSFCNVCVALFRPRNAGQYCVGRRMKFRSCNSEPCSVQRRDFREEQCATFDGRHFNINGLPPNVRWVPKYSGSKTFILLQFSSSSNSIFSHMVHLCELPVLFNCANWIQI